MRGEWQLRGAIVLLAISIATTAFAQIIPPSEQPGREQQRFIEPVAPRAQPGGVTITLPSTTAPAGAASTLVAVRNVRIKGSTTYSETDRLPLYEALLGAKVPVQAIYDLARAITAKYGNAGYVLSRAVVPPQQLNPNGATVTIEVVEGCVDRVAWPQNLARYRDFFTDYARKITAERPVNIRTIERYILLAGDLPGLKFATRLEASKINRAASTLIVEVVEKKLDVLARIDDRGTPARGPI